MIITTTEAISGFRIVKHFPIVIVNLVAATNIFADILASFSDVFGGRSETYEQYLSNLYAQATENLREEARGCGANAVVGARFDLDSVEGQHKQMFMLNAVGTPVVIKTEQEITDEQEQEEAERASRAAFEASRRERMAQVRSIKGLLDDPEIAATASELRRIYGKGVCASFLSDKAVELGLSEIVITEADVPDEL